MDARPAFDVRAFAASAAGPVPPAPGAFRERPLTADVLTAVAALAVLEGATMDRLRSVLVTPTHKDARVTAFLVTWAYERYRIAGALTAVVEAHGSGLPPRRSGSPSPLLTALGSLASGDEVVGGHTTLALVDDWMLLEAYDALERAAGSDELTDLLREISEVKARHLDFLESESRRRLADAPRTARLARRRLRRTGFPLAGRALDAESSRAFAALVDDAARTSIRDRLAALPGIDAATAAAVAERMR